MPMCPSLKLWFSPLPHRRKVWGPAQACGQGYEPCGTVASVFRPVNRLTFPLQAEPMGFCSAGSFLLYWWLTLTHCTDTGHCPEDNAAQSRGQGGQHSCPTPRAPGPSWESPVGPEKWISSLCSSSLPLGQPRFLSPISLSPVLRAGRVALTTGQCAKEQGWKPVWGDGVVPNLSLRDDMRKQCVHLLSKGTS